MADPIRGEIWLADLGAGSGHEQSGQRPVLVASDDAFNSGLSGLVMIAPLTSKIGKSKNIPAHIRMDPPEGGLKTPSVILCDQLRSISKGRLGKAPWGPVSATTLAEVEKVLRILLGLYRLPRLPDLRRDRRDIEAEDRRRRGGQGVGGVQVRFAWQGSPTDPDHGISQLFSRLMY